MATVDITNLKNLIHEQIEKAFKEGTRVGELNTACVLYSVLSNMGLEKDNIIFDMLRDIARKAECDDIEAEVQRLKNIKTTPLN